jgi:ADP-heptose:LPS heptosyltransferase
MKRSIDIITWGGIGDALLLTPTLKALKEKEPDRKIKVFYLKRHKDIFSNNPYIDSLKEVSFRSSPVDWLLNHLHLTEYKSPDYSALYPTLNYSKNLTEVIAEIFSVELVDKQMDVFLKDSELKAGADLLAGYGKTITINPYAVCSRNKEWQNEKWEELIRAMPDFTFIQLGLTKEALLKGAIDLRGKPVRESIAILKSSLYYVGVDSFLAHAAAAVNTPAVVLFGASSATVAGHKQNINLSKNLLCSPCMELIMDAVCPYGKECMRQITVEEVKTAIVKLAERK